jgi:dihydrodipicolinate synthase/N-acetylneuraminate lyase
LQHFRDVADASPIPIVVYNYPGACSGLDLNSDSIRSLSANPSIVGAKLTCGNTGKLARIVAGGTDSFAILGGSADFMLQTLVVGGQGVIAGLANIAPRSCIQIMKLFEVGKLEEARMLQAVVARGDWIAIKGGFVSVKCALQEFYGYGGLPRKPCAAPGKRNLEEMNRSFQELVLLENSF